jgi:hypothetical protein
LRVATPLIVGKRGKEIDYEAEAVALAGRRYIVCRNHPEAEKDAADPDRAAIVAAAKGAGWRVPARVPARRCARARRRPNRPD